MNHRNIPLGYALSGGIIIINEAEADTVREIAEQYLSGKSLKAIAEMLTAKHIEYMSGKTDWNRSRIFFLFLLTAAHLTTQLSMADGLRAE